MVSPFKEQALLSNMTKEAIKVGLAVSLSIILAFFFGWEKAYWAVMTVFSLAATESYTRGIVKAEHRIIGTLIGIFLAVVLVALFPQDRGGFITFLSILLVICAFMNSHKRFGYIFMMTFMLCAMIACSGQFKDELTFSLLLLRIQENVLGIVVYSLVFRLVWPKKVADSFFEEFAKVEMNGHQHLTQIQFQSLPLDDENGEQGKKNLQKKQ